MTGEKDLSRLLATMSAELRDGVFVFATTTDPRIVETAAALMVFQELEGTTLILEKGEAERLGLDFEFPCRMITLNVHSSLDAVGFMAQIAAHLTKIGMGSNPVAGYYHDHVFVPKDRATEALEALNRLSEQHRM